MNRYLNEYKLLKKKLTNTLLISTVATASGSIISMTSMFQEESDLKLASSIFGLAFVVIGLRLLYKSLVIMKKSELEFEKAKKNFAKELSK